MGFTVLQGGLQSLIKDIGRVSYRSSGVPLTGVLDPYRYFWVNGLLGNSRYNPVVEMKMNGVKIVFDMDHLFALTGSTTEMVLDDRKLQLFTVYKAKKGQVLKIGKIPSNGTVYLGIRGNWKLSNVFGSYSADLLTPFPGILGRALKRNDVIAIESGDRHPVPINGNPEELTVKKEGFKKIRILAGPEGDLLLNGDKSDFSDKELVISPDSDRMGLRLHSESPVLHRNKNMLSSFVHPGTVQATSEKSLIVLLNHGQTTGGYARIAQVIRGDMYKLAYMGPGDKIMFKWTTLEEAKYIDRYQWGQFNLLWNSYFE